MKRTLTILGLAVLAVLVFASACSQAPVDKPATQVFDLSIGHQDSYARPALVEKGAPEETNVVTFYKWSPSVLVVNKGDTVVLNISNYSAARAHSFVLPAYGLDSGVLPPTPKGETPKVVTLTFVADKAGVFPFMCGVPHDPTSEPKQCSADHRYQTGSLIVLER